MTKLEKAAAQYAGVMPDDQALIIAGRDGIDAYLSSNLHAQLKGERMLDALGAEVAQAVIRALDAAGWQCVPKVATQKMLDAAPKP